MSKFRKGVLFGDEVTELLNYANENNFALPAVNVVGTNSTNAVMETAAALNSPVIIQFSNGGATFFAGKSLSNDDQQAAVAGAISGKPIYSSHMLDLSEESIEENLEICESYMKRMTAIGITLEMELGVTGGEEDGVDNTNIDNNELYTQPEEVCESYERLSKISDKFMVAAAFPSTLCFMGEVEVVEQK